MNRHKWADDCRRGFVAGVCDARDIMCEYGYTFVAVSIVVASALTYDFGVAAIVTVATVVGIHIGRKNG